MVTHSSTLDLAVENVLSEYLQVIPGQHLWCFTDRDRLWLASALVARATGWGLAATVVDLSSDTRTPEEVQALLRSLSEADVVVAALSDGTTASRFFRVFPSFRPPEGFPGRSAVIRQRYPDDALLMHLATPPASAAMAAAQALKHDGLGRVRITTPSGTDVKCELKAAQILPYDPGTGRHVYLPPAEVTYGIVPGSANGVIVADVTVGEFVVKGDVYAPLGRVYSPVCISVADGRATAFAGGSIARQLAACFERLDREQPAGSDGRMVVELGFGLSVGTPVGLGAPDECLQGTCHFGIGNDFFFGGKNAVPMHMDVITRGPATVVPA